LAVGGELTVQCPALADELCLSRLTVGEPGRGLLFQLGALLSELATLFVEPLLALGQLGGAGVQLGSTRLILLRLRLSLLLLRLQLPLLFLHFSGGPVDRFLQRRESITPFAVAVVELPANVSQLLTGGGELLLVAVCLGEARFQRFLAPR